MSVVNAEGEKVVLTRDAGTYLEIIEREWAGKDHVRWKGLLMLQLNLFCHLTHEQIAIGFGCNQGNVTRMIASTTRAMANIAGLKELAEERGERVELRESA